MGNGESSATSPRVKSWSPIKRIRSMNHRIEAIRSSDKVGGEILLPKHFDVDDDGEEDDAETIARTINKHKVRADAGTVASSSPAEPVNSNVPLEGISMKWFLEFAKAECMGSGNGRRAQTFAVKDLAKKIKKMTSGSEESMLDMLKRGCDQISPKSSILNPVSKKADVFVSCTSRHLVVDLIASLGLFLAKRNITFEDDRDIYIWFGPITLSQHKIDNGEFTPSKWARVTKHAIDSIGRTVIVSSARDYNCFAVDSWEAWEAYCSASNQNCKIELLLPLSQCRFLREAVREDPNSAIHWNGKSALNTPIKKHRFIYTPKSRTEISPEKVAIAQGRLLSLLRDWKVQEIISFVDDAEEKGACGALDMAMLYDNISLVFGAEKMFELQETYARKALETKRRCYGELHSEVAKCMNRIGVMLFNQGRFDEAQQMFQKSINIFVATLSPKSPCVAVCTYNLAFSLVKKGDAEGALTVVEDYAALPSKAKSEQGINEILSQLRKDLVSRPNAAIMPDMLVPIAV